ncbi:MAG TPA: slipin family protein [Alphaproteobacteria bacterium]|nr:slipin family protein [Alphaproteobacteria bacterium]
MNPSSLHGANPPARILAGLLIVLAAAAGWLGFRATAPGLYAAAGVLVIAASLVPRSLMLANQWEKAVILRLGKLHAIRGAGLFFIIPFIDAVATWIDQRIRTTEFKAEQALTKDTVPVSVDAIVFWHVHDAERAALEIADYKQAIEQVAQTSLREMIGSALLATLLSERREADAWLKDVIGRKTADWGVAVTSAEIRDVTIPAALQDAMSRQAQAERERQARVLLGSAEQEVAHKFLDAAETYAKNPAALQLRAMNIIYETTKERGATVLIPSAMVDSMNPGGVLGLVAATAGKTP